MVKIYCVCTRRMATTRTGLNNMEIDQIKVTARRPGSFVTDALVLVFSIVVVFLCPAPSQVTGPPEMMQLS
jgi:hypothetical protein